MKRHMKRKNIYLDTSVISALYDDRTPERQEQTKRFWNETRNHYNSFISELVINELNNVYDKALKQQLLDVVAGINVLGTNQEVEDLAREYVSMNIIPEKYFEDAVHIAVATVNGMNYLVSWNFKHLVKAKTRESVMLSNTLLGYPILDIVAPPEL